MADKKTKKETQPKKDVKQKPKKKESAAKTDESIPKIPTRLMNYYKSEVVKHMMKTFSYKNVMQVPKLTKIVVNMGVGAAVADSKLFGIAPL